MQLVTFPGLGLEFHLSKIAFSIFEISISYYAIITVLAIVVALLLMKKDNGKYGISYDTITDLLIYLIPIGFLSARAYYVIFTFENFKGNLLQIFNFRTGGQAIYGAIIGGIITIFVFCKKRKINPLDMLDYIVPYLALGQCIGRLGNFFNIEAYGIETNLPWRMGIIENGIQKYVHPTFLYELIATFLIFLLLYIMSHNSKICTTVPLAKGGRSVAGGGFRKFKGEIIYIYLITYSFARFFIENLRTDSLMFYNIRISAILSLLVFVVFCIILSINFKKHKKTLKNS